MKKLYPYGLMIAAALGGTAGAEPSSKVAWTPETLKFVNSGNAEKGRKIAESCEACHAATPSNAGSEFPYLHGQTATYLYKQLQDYKNGSRANDIMGGIAAGLSDQDMADVAAWYGRQPVPAPGSPETVSDAALDLAESGDGRRILPPCSACHGGDGEGKTIDNPALAGQKALYLENTLLAFQSGTRHNDLYQRMHLIAQQLSKEEIRQLARYYATMTR
jgi:cytochrome c553